MSSPRERLRRWPEGTDATGSGFLARRSAEAAEIQDRLALLMVNEAVHCLQERVISSPRDGDLGAILGLGFPPFRGGPFRFIDATGAGNVVSRMQALAEKHGRRFEPAAMLTEMVKDGGKFHTS